MPCCRSDLSWFEALLGGSLPAEGGSILCHGGGLAMAGGLLRDEAIADAGQRQTSETFAFKWGREDTYSSAAVEQATRSWLVERYGDLSRPDFWQPFGERPTVLDAGCGAGLTAGLLLGDRLHRLRYVGADISAAVDVAARRFAEAGYPGAFLQADLCALPLPRASFDFILS